MIETLLSELKAAITENTTALREILSAGAAPSNVVPIAETPKPAAKGKTKVAPTPEVTLEVTPEPVNPPIAESDRPTKVSVTAAKEEEFSDPLDSTTVVVVPGTKSAIDPDTVISQITETWKTMLTTADTDRKTMLKDKFPELRTKWGLAEGAKLSTLAGSPEKLVGLLTDIKAL